MTQVLFYLLVLYILGRVFSTITGQKPSNQLLLDDIHASVKKMSGVWLIAIPLISFFAMIYNVCLTAIWFLFALAGLIVKVLGWIWSEVIVAGGYFIFQQLWHYIVVWPWRIFKMAFESIKPSFKWHYFKLGFWGLSLSLIIGFLGRFVTSNLGWWSGCELIFGLLSLIPIGIVLSNIISHYKGSNISNSELRNKYVKHVVFLLAAFFIFLAVEYSLIYLGSLTSMGYTFSALMAGGNIFVSFFIILNAGLLLFILSALPSFSQDYNGSNKELLKSFGSHLLHKWPQYLLAVPAMIIPGIIISIIPYFLSHGAIFVTQQISNAVYAEGITSAQKEVDSLKTCNYDDWANVDKLSDDSVKKEMIIDLNNIEKRAALSRLQCNSEYMNSFYNKHASVYGALPFLGVAAGYDSYSHYQKSITNNASYDTLPSSSAKTAENYKSNLDSNLIPSLTQEIKVSDSVLAKLQNDLEHACDTPRIQTISQEPKVGQTDVPTTTPTPVSIDQCTFKKENISKSISDETTNRTKLIALKVRAELISKHMGLVKEKINSLNDTGSLSANIGYFLITLWLCLIVAFCFAFITPLFAILNHSIYTFSDGTDKYFLIQKIEAANQINKNQPLLGLLLFPILLPLMISIVSYLGPVKTYSIDVINTLKLEPVCKKTNGLFQPIMSLFGFSNSCCNRSDGPAEMQNKTIENPTPSLMSASDSTVIPSEESNMNVTDSNFNTEIQIQTDTSAAVAPTTE